MRPVFLITLLFPVLTFSQPKPSVEILSKIEQLKSSSKLDSIPRNVKHFSKWYDTLNVWRDRNPWLYIYRDTIFSDGKFGVGFVIIDPFDEFNDVRYGEWNNFNLDGRLYSSGKYSVGAKIYCSPGGPVIQGYSYKTGLWRYMYDNGQKMALGRFKLKKIPFGVCGGDYEVISKTTKKWKFYSKTGLPLTDSKSIRENIDNTYW